MRGSIPAGMRISSTRSGNCKDAAQAASCWNDLWNRPGLPRKTRSLLNLAMLAALNRPHELKLHLTGALNNGVTKEEVREVFLQVAIYCGMPAAVEAFRCAREVFKERGV